MKTEEMTAWFDSAFANTSLMAVLRGMGKERSVRVAERAWEIGIDQVEVPIQTPEDEQVLAELVRRGAARGRVVGAGTILRAEQVSRAKRAGASYLVSPGFDTAVVEAAGAQAIPILPGVASASEIQQALQLGLRWMKAFPAEWLGTRWFTHMRGPFPEVRFVATGGMDASNAADFLGVGVRIVGVGSALEREDQLEVLARLVASEPI